MNWITESIAIFQKGGPVMYLLLLCSFLVVAIAVERFIYYREMQTDAGALARNLAPALERADWDAALTVCRQSGGAAGSIAEKGILSLQRGGSHLEGVLEGEASLLAAKLRENLSHLDTIITMAPLLGLLGTVIGMIGSFSVLNVKGGQPLAITGGVGEALVATAAGLCVATIALTVHSYFSHRLDQQITGIVQVCNQILTLARQGKSHEIA